MRQTPCSTISMHSVSWRCVRVSEPLFISSRTTATGLSSAAGISFCCEAVSLYLIFCSLRIAKIAGTAKDCQDYILGHSSISAMFGTIGNSGNSSNYPITKLPNYQIRLVLRPIHQGPLLEPGHHASQTRANGFNRVLQTRGFELFEARFAGFAFGHPLIGKAPGLHVSQKLLHLVADALVDDPRTARQVAILGGVRNRVAHVADAAFVYQVHDQLHFVQALEVGHLRRVAGRNQSFKACLDERGEPST